MRLPDDLWVQFIAWLRQVVDWLWKFIEGSP